MKGMCFMMGCNGDMICYVQFSQMFEAIGLSDHNINHITIFINVILRWNSMSFLCWQLRNRHPATSK